MQEALSFLSGLTNPFVQHLHPPTTHRPSPTPAKRTHLTQHHFHAKPLVAGRKREGEKKTPR
jgi:hypothetical protein